MNTIYATDFVEFWKAGKGEDARYYADRQAAMAYDPTAGRVSGFGVYDTNVSSAYAVAIYSTKQEAMAHAPSPVQKAPATAVDDDIGEFEDTRLPVQRREDDLTEEFKHSPFKRAKAAKPKRGR